MIIAENVEQRKEALSHLLPMQYQDFYAMFKAMGDKPMTIRLLDPPLHEFLPSKEELIATVARLLQERKLSTKTAKKTKKCFTSLNLCQN